MCAAAAPPCVGISARALYEVSHAWLPERYDTRDRIRCSSRGELAQRVGLVRTHYTHQGHASNTQD